MAKSKPKTVTPSDVVEFRFLLDALTAVAPEMEPRTSVRQLFAFLAVCHAEAMGHSILLSDIRNMEAENGESVVGQSIQQTFGMLLYPSDREPKALGWVRQEVDPDDKRRKFLKLTDKGHEIAVKMTRGWK